MGDIHDFINEIYNETKYSSTDTLPSRACQSVLRLAVLYDLKLFLIFFFPFALCLEWNPRSI